MSGAARLRVQRQQWSGDERVCSGEFSTAFQLPFTIIIVFLTLYQPCSERCRLLLLRVCAQAAKDGLSQVHRLLCNHMLNVMLNASLTARDITEVSWLLDGQACCTAALPLVCSPACVLPLLPRAQLNMTDAA